MINKKNIFQITIAVALGGLLFGYDTAVISGAADYFTSLFRIISS